MSDDLPKYEVDHIDSAVIKCDSCGANMVFDPSTGQLHCEYCGSNRDIEGGDPFLRDYYMESWQGTVSENGSSLVCPNCGGIFKPEQFTTAMQCPFCKATNIIPHEELDGLKPDSVLPFSLSRQDAYLAGKKFVKRKLLSPNALRSALSQDNYEGKYIPCFVFNSVTHSVYKGVLGEEETRTVGSGKDRHTETHIRYFHISGVDDLYIANRSVEATQLLTQRELRAILPYDVGEAKAYNREYIAGFSSERYSEPIDSCFEKAKDEMKEIIKKDILSRYVYDVVQSLHIDTNYDDVKFRYMLLPLWVCSYAFKGKNYRFIMNGRTGRSYGKAPKSPLKVSALVFGILAGVVGIVVLILYLAGILG